MTGIGQPTDSAKPPAQEGLSQFITRVLDQLSLSSWLPAALFVGAGALLLQVHAQAKVDVLRALVDLTSKPLGVLIVVLFALVMTAMVIQAFELQAIRWLEGYWPPTASVLGITGALVRFQASRRRRGHTRWTRKRIKAFKVAREGMLDDEIPLEIIHYLKGIVEGSGAKGKSNAEIEAAAVALEWESYCPPQLTQSMDAARRVAGSYPEAHRLMPTRLGNIIRAGEDLLQNVGEGTLRSFVIRNYQAIPPELRTIHDQYRVRLDLYCALVFVSGCLAVGGGGLLLTGHSHQHAAASTFLAFAALMVVCYKAAMTTAEGYVSALQAIDDVVGGARRESD